MAPRIVIIGGASLQWVPKLFLDIVNTPSLTESEIVLQDINPEPLPAMEDICPDAWMLNITNPMTTLCRAVTRETNVKTVGLCHEVTGAQFTLSQILNVDFRSFDFEVVGVNHLPIITKLYVDGDDAMDRLREKLADPEKLADEPIYLPDEIKR